LTTIQRHFSSTFSTRFGDFSDRTVTGDNGNGNGYRHLQGHHNGRFVFLIVASAAAAAMNLPSLLEQKNGEDAHDDTATAGTRRFSFQLDVDFMDKLANKTYLNFRRSARENGGESLRPDGLPSSLRLLTVDLPEIAQMGVKGGDGCRLAADRVYPDGIAPSKRVAATGGSPSSDTKGGLRNSLLVEQKAWVTALYECSAAASSRSGIQILQASTAALNPNGMRHNVQVGNYRYDPGKYFASNPKKQRARELHPEESRKEPEQPHSQPSDRQPPCNELDAPWNQYAWLEELQLRISGQVRFGESLEPASRWDRFAWGHVYGRTVHRPWSVWDRMGLPLGHRDRLELEGRGNAASHKPHAVIANGAALQRVPHALRWLQKTCRDEGVPLFVVRDPRRWGANTQVKAGLAVLDAEETADETDLGPVLRQVRRAVKDRIVQTCLRTATGFERGRMVGRMEANARWEAKELLRKSKEAFQPPPDWRNLDDRQLEMKLRERGVIEDDVDDPSKKLFADSLVALSKKCIESARLRDPSSVEGE
jgi:hypothetical protein